MINEDFIVQCIALNRHQPIALKFQVPYWITVTREINPKFLRLMQLHDTEWMFFALQKKTDEKELRDLLNVIAPYCEGACYFV